MVLSNCSVELLSPHTSALELVSPQFVPLLPSCSPADVVWQCKPLLAGAHPRIDSLFAWLACRRRLVDRQSAVSRYAHRYQYSPRAGFGSTPRVAGRSRWCRLCPGCFRVAAPGSDCLTRRSGLRRSHLDQHLRPVSIFARKYATCFRQ
jgi:hypothetical protein